MAVNRGFVALIPAGIVTKTSTDGHRVKHNILQFLQGGIFSSHICMAENMPRNQIPCSSYLTVTSVPLTYHTRTRYTTMNIPSPVTPPAQSVNFPMPKNQTPLTHWRCVGIRIRGKSSRIRIRHISNELNLHKLSSSGSYCLCP